MFINLLQEFVEGNLNIQDLDNYLAENKINESIFEKLMVQLDMLLTGSKEEFARKIFRDNYFQTSNNVSPLQEFALGEAYYLSDGGISRLVYDSTNHNIFATSNSSVRVKEILKQNKEAKAKITALADFIKHIVWS